jgi:hypothetical protein
MDLLFKPGASCEKYKCPKNTYDFNNQVLVAMKVQYERVTGPGSHSSSQNPGDHEDVVVVDKLAVSLYIEIQEGIDTQEALRCNNFRRQGECQHRITILAPHPQLGNWIV